MKIKIYTIEGKHKGTMDLDTDVFDGKVNKPLMQQAVVTYLANQRKGLACAKTRGEVSGGGRKPWRQKGTGRARVGSTRSPLWRGGGVTFGPRPHSFRKDLPKRMKILALKSALNAKVKDEELMILDSLTIDSHKTKEFAVILKNLKLDGVRTRFILESLDENIKRSSKNIKKTKTQIAQDVSTVDVLDCKTVVFTKEAFLKLQERVKSWLKEDK